MLSKICSEVSQFQKEESKFYLKIKNLNTIETLLFAMDGKKGGRRTNPHKNATYFFRWRRFLWNTCDNAGLIFLTKN